MNVRITPRENLQRHDLYSGVTRIWSTGVHLLLYFGNTDADYIPLSRIALIELDNAGGMWW